MFKKLFQDEDIVAREIRKMLVIQTCPMTRLLGHPILCTRLLDSSDQWLPKQDPTSHFTHQKAHTALGVSPQEFVQRESSLYNYLIE